MRDFLSRAGSSERLSSRLPELIREWSRMTWPPRKDTREGAAIEAREGPRTMWRHGGSARLAAVLVLVLGVTAKPARGQGPTTPTEPSPFGLGPNEPRIGPAPWRGRRALRAQPGGRGLHPGRTPGSRGGQSALIDHDDGHRVPCATRSEASRRRRPCRSATCRCMGPWSCPPGPQKRGRRMG